MFTLCRSESPPPSTSTIIYFSENTFGVLANACHRKTARLARRDISERADVMGPPSSPRRAGAAGGQATMFAQICVSNAGAENNERREIVEIDFVYQER